MRHRRYNTTCVLKNIYQREAMTSVDSVTRNSCHLTKAPSVIGWSLDWSQNHRRYSRDTKDIRQPCPGRARTGLPDRVCRNIPIVTRLEYVVGHTAPIAEDQQKHLRPCLHKPSHHRRLLSFLSADTCNTALSAHTLTSHPFRRVRRVYICDPYDWAVHTFHP